MHRRQLLARVMTTGLVLVGGASLLERHQKAVDLFILLKAQDEASAVLSQGRASFRLDNRDRRFDPYNMPAVSMPFMPLRVRSGPPYVVGEHGPDLFVPYIPAGKPRADIDYKQLGETISRAIQEMPPPRVAIQRS